MEQQLNLIKNIKQDYKDSDYVLAKSNEHAYVELIEKPQPLCTVLYGVQGTGKTHLANIWRKKHNAYFASYYNKSKIIQRSCIVDDFDKNFNEIDLLHLYNIAKEYSNYILCTTSTPIQNIVFTLPDLRSRLISSRYIKLKYHSDEVLKVIIIKEFFLRHIRISPEVVNYIIVRVDRSFNSIINLIERISDSIHEKKCNLTLNLVSKIMKNIEE